MNKKLKVKSAEDVSSPNTRSRRSLNSSKSAASLSKTCQNFKPTKVEKNKFKRSLSLKKLEKRLSSGKIDSTPIKTSNLVEEPIKDVTLNESNNNNDNDIVKIKEEKPIPGKSLGVIPAMYEMWKKQRKKKLESPNKGKTQNSLEEQPASKSTIKSEEQSFLSKRNRKMDFSFSKEKKAKKLQIRGKREEDIIPKENIDQIKEPTLPVNIPLTNQDVILTTNEDKNVDQTQESQNSEANETLDKSATKFPFWKSKRHKSKKSYSTKTKKEKVLSPRKGSVSEIEKNEHKSKQESIGNPSNTEYSSIESDAVNTTVIKSSVRKRGRPRKKQPQEKIELSREEISMADKVELKISETDCELKKSETEFECNLSEINHPINQSEVESLDTKPKAKRGRKPKKKGHLSKKNSKIIDDKTINNSISSEKIDVFEIETAAISEIAIDKTEDLFSKNESNEIDVLKPEMEINKNEQSTTFHNQFDSKDDIELTRNLSVEDNTIVTEETEKGENLTRKLGHNKPEKKESEIPEAEKFLLVNNETKDNEPTDIKHSKADSIELNVTKWTSKKSTEIDTREKERVEAETKCKESTEIVTNRIELNETETVEKETTNKIIDTNEDESTETQNPDIDEKAGKEEDSSSSDEEVKYTPTKPVTRTKVQQIDYRNSLNSKIDKTDSTNPYKKSFLVKEVIPQDEKSLFKTSTKNDETSDKTYIENEKSRDERSPTKLTKSFNTNVHLETVDQNKTDANNPYKKTYSTSSRTRNSPNCLSVQKNTIEKTQKARVAKSLIEKAHILKKKKQLSVSPIKIMIKSESISQGRPKRQTKSNFNKSDFVYEIKSSSGKRKYEIEDGNKSKLTKLKRNNLKKTISAKECVPIQTCVLPKESSGDITEKLEDSTSIEGEFLETF